MSWIQNLHDTYEACSDSIYCDSGAQEKMLLPVSHTLKKSDVVIHLKSDGTFADAEKSEAMICTPCTDESESRTIRAADTPHPLFDQVKHLTGKKYRENLYLWKAFLSGKPEHLIASSMITALYQYIDSGTLKEDLLQCNIKPDGKFFVRFCVRIDGHLEDRLWQMPEIWDAWNAYYKTEHLDKSDKKNLCYVSGVEDLAYTEKHPKSINRASGNAKLITGNDKDNYTYRGRFEKPFQAVTVSYECSQKAHQALRWLIQNQGYRCGTQAIVAWAIDKMPELPAYYDHSYGIYDDSTLAVSGAGSDPDSIVFADYAKLIKKSLDGYTSAKRLEAHSRKVAVLATDSATTGRMSVTYYRELAEHEYLERIAEWHSTCKWFQPYGKDRNGKWKPGYFIGAPSFERITVAVNGKRRSASDKSYENLKKSLRERLLHCIFDGERISKDMVISALHRASNPLTLENTDSNIALARWSDWEQVLCTACALVKRYYHDYEKEDYEVALELSRQDRDYLYGRLLAVADSIESLARYKQGSAKGDLRATNAIRYMTTFSQRPFRTWNMLFTQQLNPYIQQLSGANWHMNMIGDIISLFKAGEFEMDTPLKGGYLLGFFAQRQELRTKKKNTEDNLNGGQ